MTEIDAAAPPVQRIRVARVRDIPPGAVQIFGSVIWANRYRYRSQHGFAREPAALSDAAWEYEGRIGGLGRHDYHYEAGHVPQVLACQVRYMTRRECQEVHRRVLTGEGDPELRGHRLAVSLPEIVRALKGKVLACTCPFPKDDGPDWCHGATLAGLAASLSVARLDCLTPAAARAVVAEADRPGTNRATAFGDVVFLSYFDKRYPLDVAGWAADHGHASDAAAGKTIGGL